MSNTAGTSGKGVLPASARMQPYAGSIERNRERIDKAIAYYHRHLKAVKPMVAVKNLSPQFLEMAIQLDVRLAEYRYKVGRFQLLMRLCERMRLQIERKSSSGRIELIPELREIEIRCAALSDTIPEMIRKIEKTKAIRHGDRVLNECAAELGNDHWWRQLDWLEVMFAGERWEREAGTFQRRGIDPAKGDDKGRA